ncbi:hypothetical protein WJX74_001809 [Apatococcus lobatus]|uniref:Uncharacterized protein n=1 Tax=Apatococcus lobatus TaxID=904363 RepID=A0AAW1RVI1_9CHLO
MGSSAFISPSLGHPIPARGTHRTRGDRLKGQAANTLLSAALLPPADFWPYESLKFNPFATSRLSHRRAVRQPLVSCTGRSKVDSRTVLRDVGQLHLPKGILAAATGLSTLFLANPALAELDSTVVNTAQQFGTAGVAMIVSSAATYGGILLVQHMLRGLGGQQQKQQQQQQQEAHHPEQPSSSYARKGGNVPALAFGGPSGTPSPTSLSFQEKPSKPYRAPSAVAAPAQSKPAPPQESKSVNKTITTEVTPATTSSSASHELLASMDAAPEPAAHLSSPAPQHTDSLFTAARGKSLQTNFRHGSGCSGHSRAAVDFVSDLLSPITEPASGSKTAQADSASQAQTLPQEHKAADLVSEFAAAAEAAGDLLGAAEKESMTAEQQQAEYNARLKVIRIEASRKAAEEARRHQLRQRALDHMQPASHEFQQQPVPAAVLRKAQTPPGNQYLAGLATFLASLLAWLQAMWQRLVQTVTGLSRSRFSPSSV